MTSQSSPGLPEDYFTNILADLDAAMNANDTCFLLNPSSGQPADEPPSSPTARDLFARVSTTHSNGIFESAASDTIASWVSCFIRLHTCWDPVQS